jgi:hypothetical protein
LRLPWAVSGTLTWRGGIQGFVVRYLFRGIIRDTGRVVDGHVQANEPNEACNYLAENGIVTESLREDPIALNLSQDMAPKEFASAIDSALDVSSTQVAFDGLIDRYKGKQVWVIDRDKIRSRVAQVVDAALDQSAKESEGAQQTRERVALAIQTLFTDNRNLTSPANPALDQQIARLGSVIHQAEGALAALMAAARRMEAGGGGPRRLSYAPAEVPEDNQEVLLEIFKSNLELKRSLEAPPAATPTSPTTPPPPTEGAAAGAGMPASSSAVTVFPAAGEQPA